MLKTKLFLVVAAGVIISLAAGCGQTQKAEEVEKAESSGSEIVSEAPSEAVPKAAEVTPPGSKVEEIAVIDTAKGQITFKFYLEDAPNHVSNFKKLAQSGFYNGTTFHRIIPGFMIQGGDPNSKDEDRSNDGTGGPGYMVKAEFNSHPHIRGAVSMARGPHPDTAGSQFFICVAPQPYLDGQYTVFGQVIKGLEVVDTIVNVPRDTKDNPLEKVVMNRVKIVQQ